MERGADDEESKRISMSVKILFRRVVAFHLVGTSSMGYCQGKKNYLPSSVNGTLERFPSFRSDFGMMSLFSTLSILK